MLMKIAMGGFLLVACVSVAMGQMRRGDDMFEQADSDNDGTISREEFRIARAAQFEKRDQNADGSIDDSDLPKRAAGRPRIAAAVGAMRAQFDLNGDGKITKDEFVDGAMPLFDKADSDSNGYLDAKERDAARETAKARAGEFRR